MKSRHFVLAAFIVLFFANVVKLFSQGQFSINFLVAAALSAIASVCVFRRGIVERDATFYALAVFASAFFWVTNGRMLTADSTGSFLLGAALLLGTFLAILALAYFGARLANRARANLAV